ncbi:hypothetical protein EC957_008027 [Mortierella hygrophila]|uniref:WW domain-containing protein n=1 Tax=Mortierella hygrophila TaxID=979708 RepID=A0A9P6FBQ0_9FUNG|nr:hypothetical protein EC957_008027 [Mortierella hygrophila]
MSSFDTKTSTPQKTYNAPGVANLPYNQRPLPPGWISQYDPTHQAYFYVDENTNPPTITWEDPRPAYYMAQERGQYAPPPPGMQASSPAQQRRSPPPQPQSQPQPQQQPVQTVIHNADGSVTTLTSQSNQPIIIQSAAPQQQQQPQPQQVHSSGPSVGRAIVGTAVVTSLLRPRPRVIVAPRRRFR